MSNGLAGGVLAQPAALSYRDMLTSAFQRPPPLVDGLLDQGTGVILAGPAGVGKTWIALDLIRAVASGTPWLERFPTNAGTVLVIDEESSLWGIQDRLRMLEAGHQLGPDLPVIFSIGQAIRLDTQDGATRLEALICEHKPVLVVIDSFTRIHALGENSAGEMAALFRVATALMNEYGCCILFIDHVRKKGLVDVPDEVLRGSSEKRAWPSTVLFAAAGESGQVTITHSKARYHEPQPSFSVAIEVDADADSARVRHSGAVASSAVTRGNDIIEAIHAIKGQLGDDGADATTVSAWLDCSPDTVRRHITTLIQAGLVTTRSIPSSAKGGRPKDVYDIVGGRE